MSNTKPKSLISLVLAGAVLSSGCSFKTAPKEPHSENEKTLKSEWIESSASSDRATLKVKTLKPEVMAQHKKRFSVPELEVVKSDFAGSFTLYKLGRLSEELAQARDIVFIQPKLFVYGTAQGGNVLQISSNGGKTSSLTFPVAFVDGLRSSLPSVEGIAAVTLPAALKIPDVEKLRDDLKSQLGFEPKLMALPSCHRNMALVHLKGSDTRRIPLQPVVPIQNRCPIDEFFSVTLSSSRTEIYDIVQNGISSGLGVQVEADFQVLYREPTAYYSLSLNAEAIYADLRETFVTHAFGQASDPTIYFAYQLIKPLEELLKNEIEQIGADAGWVPYFQGVQLLLDSFFERVDPEDGCAAPNRCFRLKSEFDVSMGQPLELDWFEQSVLAATNIIPTVTFVKGLAETYPIKVSSERNLPMLGIIPTRDACFVLDGNLPGCPGFSCDKFPDNVYCRNGRTKNAVHYFQVFPGAKIRLSFNHIAEWGYGLSAPREDTSDAQKRGTLRCADGEVIPGACEEYEEYCLEDTVPLCTKPKDECAETHKLYEEQCKTENTTERSCGFLGLGHCEEVLKENKVTCEKIETGSECLKWKTNCDGEMQMVCPKTDRRCKIPAKVCHQWTTEFYSKYTYSEPWVRPQGVDIQNGETIEELWDGLDLEFSWLKEDGNTWGYVTCPIKAFSNRIEGYSITLALDNQAGTDCMPFDSWNTLDGRWPEIAIINHINFEKPYLCGTLEWTRSISVDPSTTEKVIDRLEYRCPERPDLGSSDKPIVNTFQPIVDLSGTISILGRSMDTLSSVTKP